MGTDKLDKTDLQLLRVLQQNARMTTKELAHEVNLSTTPVFERLKRLERDGIIKKYIAIYCCPVNFQTAQESFPKPFRIGLRGFFFKKQAP